MLSLTVPISCPKEYWLPTYALPSSAGLDLRAALNEPLHLEPMERKAIPTGLRMAIPEGYEGQIRPRSGLALTHGITVLNAPGTIDAGYRGEIQVILIHLGSHSFRVEPGMRIAQLVIAPVLHVTLCAMEILPSSIRQEKGLGSTGVE